MRISILIGMKKILKSVLRQNRDYAEIMIKKAIKTATLLDKQLTEENITDRIQNYRKYVILRHPLERLVAAYRDKLSAPLIRSPKRKYFELLKHNILLQYHPNAHRMWQSNSNHPNVFVPFEAFIHFIVDSNDEELNEHFQTQLTVCKPCLMQYNFYGDFRNYSRDAMKILQQFTSDVSGFTSSGYHKPAMETRALLQMYYSQLSSALKEALAHKWQLELEFYHLLFPDEQQLTERLLRVPTPQSIS